MDLVFRTLAETASKQSSTDTLFFRVEAEVVNQLSRKYDVSIVPTFLLLDERKAIVDRVEGTEASKLTLSVRKLLSMPLKSASSPSEAKDEGKVEEQQPKLKSEEEILDAKLHALINSAPMMIFMKGSPTEPKCGFSRQCVEILKTNSIPFHSFDILDPAQQHVRKGLKTYSDWPTYPQLYANGELVGGLDILKEMIEDESTSLAEQLGINKEQDISLEERLNALLSRSKLMLFMKGLPSAPKCGFSRQIVELLGEAKFDAFDILTDDEVRQGLKKLSDWPTYPQLYLDGELVGGLDIVQEMVESGEFSEMIKGL